MDENARLREALADMVALFSADNVLLKGTHLNSTLKLARAALTPAPEAPKGGEGLPGVMPRYFAVQSVSGVHIGMWEDGKIASEVLSEYPGGKIIEMVDVYAVPRATPTPGADFKAGLMRAAEIAEQLGVTWEAVCMGANKGGVCHTACDACLARAEADPADYISTAIRAEAEKITSSDAGGAHGCAVQTSQPGGASASSVPAPLTLRAGRRYVDGHGAVKGPLHRIHWENGERMLSDGVQVWLPDGTLAGGPREDKRSLVAEVVE